MLKSLAIGAAAGAVSLPLARFAVAQVKAPKALRPSLQDAFTDTSSYMTGAVTGAFAVLLTRLISK